MLARAVLGAQGVLSGGADAKVGRARAIRGQGDDVFGGSGSDGALAGSNGFPCERPRAWGSGNVDERLEACNG